MEYEYSLLIKVGDIVPGSVTLVEKKIYSN